jgi:hypothetical protein
MRTPNTWRTDRRRRREIADAIRGEFELEPRTRFGGLRRLASNVASFERERIRSHTGTAPAPAVAPRPVAQPRSTDRPVVERPVPPRSP